MQQTLVDFLERLLASNLLNDTFPRRLTDFMARDDTWYARMCKEDDHDTAFTTLLKEEWVRQGKVYGTAVRSIIEAMLDVARADTCAEIAFYHEPGSKDYAFPILGTGHTRTAVTVINPEHRGYGYTVPEGYQVWGRDATLKSIAAVVGTNAQGRVELGLIFPTRITGDYAHAGFTTIEISPDGTASGTTLYRKLTPWDMALEALGVKKEPMGGHTGGSVDGHLGFPNAEKYLLEHLPSLAPYLRGMAGQLREKGNTK